MSPGRVVYIVDIDRVVVSGLRGLNALAGLRGPEALRGSDFNALVEAAVTRNVAVAPLPPGRAVRSAVRFDAAPPTGGAPAVADAVAQGVAHAIGGGRRG